MFKDYFYSKTIPKISQGLSIGFMSMRGLQGAGKSRQVCTSTQTRLKSVPCGALTVIGVSTLPSDKGGDADGNNGVRQVLRLKEVKGGISR